MTDDTTRPATGSEHLNAIRVGAEAIVAELGTNRRLDQGLGDIIEHAEALAEERDALAAQVEAMQRPDRVLYEHVHEWESGARTTGLSDKPTYDPYQGWTSTDRRRAHVRDTCERFVVRTLHVYVVDEYAVRPRDVPEGGAP